MQIGQQDTPQQVLTQPLLSLGLLRRLRLEHRGQMQDLGGGPAGQQAQKVAQVAQRLESMQTAADQQQDPDGVDLGARAAAAEQLVAVAHDLAAQGQFAAVVL